MNPEQEYANLRFMCPVSGALVDLNHCEDCVRKDNCDMRATMMDEDFSD